MANERRTKKAEGVVRMSMARARRNLRAMDASRPRARKDMSSRGNLLVTRSTRAETIRTGRRRDAPRRRQSGRRAHAHDTSSLAILVLTHGEAGTADPAEELFIGVAGVRARMTVAVRRADMRRVREAGGAFVGALDANDLTDR